jgi:transmembrane sensor
MTRVDTRGLAKRGQMIAATLGEGPAAADLEAQRRLIGEVAFGAAPSAHPWRWLPAAAAAMIAVAAMVVLAVARPAREARFWVAPVDRPGRAGAWLQAEATRPLLVRFDSGTELLLHPGAGARVAAASRAHNRVTLHEGAATSRVHGLESGRWTIEAGPYNVTALGTEFVVRWVASAEALDVEVARGLVLVEGTGLRAEGLRVSMGETLKVRRGGEIALLSPGTGASRLEASAGALAAAAPGPKTAGAPAPEAQSTALPGAAANGVPTVRRSRPERSAAMPEAEAPAAPAAAEAPAGPTGATGPEAAPPAATATPAWKEAFLRGDHEAAAAAAEAGDLAALLRALPRDDLQHLSDAARYARRVRLARLALTTMRERFPGSVHARTAAFVLGRVAEELANDHREAARWFETYLREDPSGDLAEEALGRRIGACRKAGLHDEARAAATRYLQQHRGGVFDGVAREALR